MNRKSFIVPFLLVAICLFNACYGSDGSGSSNPGTSVEKPDEVTGITAEPGNGEVVVSWNSVSEAESYTLYFSIDAAVDVLTATQITGLTGTSYTHGTLDNLKTYHYAIIAVNPAGQSELSSEVSAMPQTGIAGVYVSKFGAYGSDDGQLIGPRGITVDSSGNIYVVDRDNCRVQKFSASGDYLMQFGSNGTGNGKFNFPYGIAVDSSGNIYVSDFSNYTVQKFNSSGEYVSQLYNNEGKSLYYPAGVAIDKDGYIYVVESPYNAGRVFKYKSDGTYMATIGSEDFATADSVAIDGSGNLYVTDMTKHCVRKYDSSGSFVKEWGKSGNESGSGNGEFSSPMGIAVDTSGNVYVADYDNSRVQKFDSSGGYISQWGSSGTGNGEFNFPYSVAVDSSGYLYVTDCDNNRVQKFR